MLCAITERLLPEHYSREMLGVRIDNLVLVDLLNASSLREVLRTITDAGMEVELLSTQWFLLAFLNALPTETVSCSGASLSPDSPTVSRARAPCETRLGH